MDEGGQAAGCLRDFAVIFDAWGNGYEMRVLVLLARDVYPVGLCLSFVQMVGEQRENSAAWDAVCEAFAVKG